MPGCRYNKENGKYKIVNQPTKTCISVQSIDVCVIDTGVQCFLHATFSVLTAVQRMSPIFSLAVQYYFDNFLSDSDIFGCGEGPILLCRRPMGTLGSPLIQSRSGVAVDTRHVW